jgi:uncharacterized protein (TIGR02118 family)
MTYTLVFETYQDEKVGDEEFIAHWTGPHAQIVAKLPRLRGYEILHVTSAIEAGEPAPDGFVVLRFDSREDADAALASAEMKAAGEDAEGYFRDFAAFHVDTHRIV